MFKQLQFQAVLLSTLCTYLRLHIRRESIRVPMTSFLGPSVCTGVYSIVRGEVTTKLLHTRKLLHAHPSLLLIFADVTSILSRKLPVHFPPTTPAARCAKARFSAVLRRMQLSPSIADPEMTSGLRMTSPGWRLKMVAGRMTIAPIQPVY